MKYLTKLVYLLTLFSAGHVWADFDLPGKGQLVYPTGVAKEFNFGFGWQSDTQKFRIGERSYDMAQIPESYSIAITLSKDDSKVWVQEFNPGFIEGFSWQLGEHKLELFKKQFMSPVKGDYVLRLDDIDYFLVRNNLSVTIKFTEQGIDNIKLDGVTKNMGTKQ
ncbi:hypothetical protein [Pseudoalteromonas rubra]|uniref:Uncharacterized protein n=1 Tax=Pseudoalteromonas rubra TaxID=43658 RepID=A0A4Q7E756_9GAMM|nr:hypothetical protein [Pseudoalteromonas rubra]RZM78109.1 hypothetical protein C3B51_15665 [Pseudoalteromonas rubra]